MHPLPEGIITILAAFAPLFSDRVWYHAQELMTCLPRCARRRQVGAILSPGKRTVSAALRVMGRPACTLHACLRAARKQADRSEERHFTNYHRVLNRVKWNSLQGSRILLGLLLAMFPSPGAIVLGVDLPAAQGTAQAGETIERRSGKKIKHVGCYRDPVRSTRKHVVRCFGVKWVSMMLLVPVPFSHRIWALPFLTLPCEPEVKEKNANSGKKKPTHPSRGRHKTSVDWARQTCLCVLSHARRQVIKQVHRWLPNRLLVLVVDGGFAAMSLMWACKGISTTMVSRLRWDAALYHPPKPRQKGQRGPTPKKGQRQRRLRTPACAVPGTADRWAARSDTPWQSHKIFWYGGTRKTMLLFSRTALWYRPGFDPMPIRYVIVKDPQGKLKDEVFFCTDPSLCPLQILEWVVMRWSVEVTFEEARAHLGLETQRQWSDLTVERTTPCLLALFSIVTLMTLHLCQDNAIPIQTTAWYKKQQPTFSDCILLVRRHIWRARFLVNSAPEAEFVQFPKEMLDLLCMFDLPVAA